MDGKHNSCDMTNESERSPERVNPCEVIRYINLIRKAEHRDRQGLDPLRGQGYVLYHLCHRGGVAQPGELSEELNVTTPRMTSILTALERQGLIRRDISPNDRRKVVVRLTEDGEELVRRHDQSEVEKCQRLIDELGVDDSAALLRILSKIVQIKNA